MASIAACEQRVNSIETVKVSRLLRKGLLSSLIFVWLSVFVPIDHPTVHAHGDHGEAAPPEGGVSLIAFEGFQAELLASPRPPRAGEETKIVLNILRSNSFEPVRNGAVLMGVSPAASHDSSSGQQHSHARGHAETDSIPLVAVREMTWAGNYTLVKKLDHPGVHIVRALVSQLGEKTFNPPHLLEFRLNIAPATGFGASLLALFVAASVIGVAGMYWAVLRARPGVELGRPLNLLNIGWLNRFVLWKGFQPVLQIPMLVLTIVIMLVGFFDIQDGAKNLATKLTWIVWWPGIVFTFILVGRLWCVACPFGVLNEMAARWANPQRLFPRALRGLWLATLLFVVLTWADEQLGIIRSPRMTGWLILVLALAAVTTGLYFQRRSFCRYLCPITGLQALYSMMSPVELRSIDRDLCSKDCHQSCYRGTETAAGCPMFEFPMTLDRNTYCNFCFECVKSCPADNIVLRFRSFGGDLWSSVRRSLDESYLALALVGLTTIVTAQMLSDWGKWISGLSRLLPLAVRALVKPVTYLTLTETLLFVFVALLFVPLLGYLAAWTADRLTGGKGRGARRVFVVLGYMFIPVGLAMHLSHNLSHLLMEGAGVAPGFQRLLSRFTFIGVAEPDWNVAPMVDPNIIYALQMALILIGLVFSIIAGTRLATKSLGAGKNTGKALVPFIALSLLFTLINLYMLNQPMGMRHGM